MRWIILLVLGCTLPDLLMAQNEANWWYFGQKAAIDFNSGQPVSYTHGSMSHLEGSASISHPKSGKLLFYTDGMTVWDKNHQVMPNGRGLKGHSSSSHSAIIVPDPGDTNRFFIFTAPYPESNGMRMSEVDMRLNSGSGDLDTVQYSANFPRKNRFLMNRNPSTDKIAVTKHANGRHYWVVGIEYNQWHLNAYEIKPGGIDTIQKPTLTFLNGTSTTLPHYGCIKFSPDGSKLAMAVGPSHEVHVYDFNSSNGSVGKQRILGYAPQGQGFLPYGIEFSPNSKYLYVVADGLIQYNLSLDSAHYISASAVELTTPSINMQNGQIQLAPDGKIYFARGNMNYLSVVEHPNNPGKGASFKEIGVRPSIGSRVRLGLPSFSSHLFRSLSLIVMDGCITDSIFVQFSDTSEIDSVKVDYGDPSSGIFNRSTKLFSRHAYANSGRYGIKAIVYKTNPMGGVIRDTLIDSVNIGRAPQISLGKDTTLCWGDTIFAAIASNWSTVNYWDDSSQVDFRIIKKTGKIWLQAQNICGIASDTLEILGLRNQGLDLGKDTLLCAGKSIQFNITDINATYLWDNGTKIPVRTISTAGTYWAELSNFCGVYRDTIEVDTGKAPMVNFGSDTSVCDTVLYTLIATNKSATYQWHDGSTLDQFQVQTSGKYWVEVRNSCGITSDTIEVKNDKRIRFNLGQDTTICPLDSMNVYASPRPPTYLWSTGSQADHISIEKEGSYWLDYSNACGSWSDTIKVTKYPITNHTITYVKGTLIAPRGMALYVWHYNGKPMLGKFNPTLNVEDTGRYFVQITDVNGCTDVSNELVIGKNGVVFKEEHLSEKETMKVYPNPVRDFLIIENLTSRKRNYQVSMMDYSGRTVLIKEELSMEGGTHSKISVGHLPLGTYVLLVRSKDRIHFQRIVIID